MVHKYIIPKLKDREKELFADKPVHLSANGGAFLFLAESLCKADSGVIATVLPLMAATANSGQGIRCYLASKFHIETIVTSHDQERIYFSENTTIGEMLLVCRRWDKKKGQKPPTRVVNLARNPATPADAFNVAVVIADGRAFQQGYGTVQEWPEPLIAAGDWGAAQFLSPYLCGRFQALKGGELLPIIELGQVAQVGPEGRRIRDAFTRSKLPGDEGMTALWEHSTDDTQSMAAKPDSHIIPKPPRAHLAANYWQQRSTFLLPNRMGLSNVRTMSVRLEMPVVGSSWSPCNFAGSAQERENWEKAVCVYFNSSLGVLAMLGNRSNRVPSYPRFSIDDMRNYPVPDFAALGAAAVAQLAAAYDEYADAVLRPLPQLNDCPARQGLDAAVIAALGVDGELVANIRRQLAMEPSVTGQRYAGFER